MEELKKAFEVREFCRGTIEKLDLKAEGGWHAKADLSDEAGSRLLLTRNTTMWKKWESSTYDGIREDAR